MRLLVTGGAGFIASHLADALAAEGHALLVLDDLSTGSRANLTPSAELVEASINSPEAEAAIASFRPEGIFHHAAQLDVRVSVARPAFDAEVNVVGTVRLLAAAAQVGCKVFVMASTGGAIYGEQDVFPAPEDHATRPVSPYGVSKLCGEHYVDYFASTHGMRSVKLRYANVYGPRQDPHGEAGVVAIFCGRMLEGKPVVINGDGLQTRDYVYVGDVVRANLLALGSAVSGALNVGTGVETDVVTLARCIAAETGYEGAMEHGPAKPGEQLRSVLDASKTAEVLGWKPEHTLEQGLASTVAYFRGQ